MNSMAALLAFPSRAGAFNRRTSSSSRLPLNAVFFALGMTRIFSLSGELIGALQTKRFRCEPWLRLLQSPPENRCSFPSISRSSRAARKSGELSENKGANLQHSHRTAGSPSNHATAIVRTDETVRRIAAAPSRQLLI